MTHDERKQLIVPLQPEISVRKQAELLEISRASLSYRPVVNERNLAIMRSLDELYTKYPFYGSRRMRYALHDDYRLEASREHVQRLMRIMGLEAIYPRKSRNTSIPDPSHRVYPYLIRGVIASRPNHIWGMDITYIRLEKSWCYLMAILDWYSRHVVAWELSDTMESGFCITAWNAHCMAQFPLSPTWIRVANSQIAGLPDCWHNTERRSAWTAEDDAWTTSSPSGCGEPSSTRRSI